jgi:hypothetical protein
MHIHAILANIASNLISSAATSILLHLAKRIMRRKGRGAGTGATQKRDNDTEIGHVSSEDDRGHRTGDALADRIAELANTPEAIGRAMLTWALERNRKKVNTSQ